MVGLLVGTCTTVLLPYFASWMRVSDCQLDQKPENPEVGESRFATQIEKRQWCPTQPPNMILDSRGSKSNALTAASLRKDSKGSGVGLHAASSSRLMGTRAGVLTCRLYEFPPNDRQLVAHSFAWPLWVCQRVIDQGDVTSNIDKAVKCTGQVQNPRTLDIYRGESVTCEHLRNVTRHWKFSCWAALFGGAATLRRSWAVSRACSRAQCAPYKWIPQSAHAVPSLQPPTARSVSSPSP